MELAWSEQVDKTLLFMPQFIQVDKMLLFMPQFIQVDKMLLFMPHFIQVDKTLLFMPQFSLKCLVHKTKVALWKQCCAAFVNAFSLSDPRTSLLINPK